MAESNQIRSAPTHWIGKHIVKTDTRWYYKSCTYDGKPFNLYDPVLLNSDDATLPLGRIIGMWEGAKKKWIDIEWYYRASDVFKTIEFFHPAVVAQFLRANPAFGELLVRREAHVDDVTRATDPGSSTTSHNNTAPGSPASHSRKDKSSSDAPSQDSSENLIDLNADGDADGKACVVDLTRTDEDKKKRRRRESRPAPADSTNGHDTATRARKGKRGNKKENGRRSGAEDATPVQSSITDPRAMLEYLKQCPANEVFVSSHIDSNYPSTIARKCVVECAARVADPQAHERQPSHYIYRKQFDHVECVLFDTEEVAKPAAEDMALKLAKRVDCRRPRHNGRQASQNNTTHSDMDSDEILNSADTPQENRALSGPPVKRRRLANKRESVTHEKENETELRESRDSNHSVNTAAPASRMRDLRTFLRGELSESSEGEPAVTGPGRGRKRKSPEPQSNSDYLNSLRIEYTNYAPVPAKTPTTNGQNSNQAAKPVTQQSTIDMILDDDYQGASEVQMLERTLEKVHEAVDLSRQALESFKKQISARIHALEELS